MSPAAVSVSASAAEMSPAAVSVCRLYRWQCSRPLGLLLWRLLWWWLRLLPRLLAVPARPPPPPTPLRLHHRRVVQERAGVPIEALPHRKK
eukprot:116838-Prorocentrum_minimum.AAC.2